MSSKELEIIREGRAIAPPRIYDELEEALDHQRGPGNRLPHIVPRKIRLDNQGRTPSGHPTPPLKPIDDQLKSSRLAEKVRLTPLLVSRRTSKGSTQHDPV